MNLSSTPELSVYQLALGTLAPSQSLRVSPTTLKSLVGALIDVLVAEKISATLIVKLPPGESWQVELERYQQQVKTPQPIYLCSGFEDKLVETPGVVGQATNNHRNSQFFPLQLANGKLKREYFLIALAEPFSCLIAASQLNQSELVAARLKPTKSWLAVCTFKREVIQRVWQGITSVIATETIPAKLQQRWQAKSSQLDAANEQALLTQVLVKQVQRTERLLHSPTTTNRSKDTATTDPSLPHDSWNDHDQLIKQVAQELRTPLTNMKTALRLLDSPQLKPPQRQRYMQLLHTECDRQNSLITGLLELVQLGNDSQPSVLPSVQLVDIVPGIVSTYQPIAQEKGIQLGYTVPSHLPAVSCLETWLRQIVINLLNNSLKFTPSGGQVRVRATLQGEYVQIAVSDTGIGIATSEIPRIFDSFYRGRSTISEETGAGLGLTIVQRLLLRCGGSVSVTSKLGEGSTVKVLLPIASPTINSNS